MRVHRHLWFTQDMDANELPDLLRPGEVAAYLRVSVSEVYRLMQRGHLPYQMVAGVRRRRLVRRADLDGLLVRQRAEPAPPTRRERTREERRVDEGLRRFGIRK